MWLRIQWLRLRGKPIIFGNRFIETDGAYHAIDIPSKTSLEISGCSFSKDIK